MYDLATLAMAAGIILAAVLVVAFVAYGGPVWLVESIVETMPVFE